MTTACLFRPVLENRGKTVLSVVGPLLPKPPLAAHYSIDVKAPSRKALQLDRAVFPFCSRVSGEQIRMMKRKATDSQAASKAKRVREAEPDYCDAQCYKDENDSIIWPASQAAMESARAFLEEWYITCCLLIIDKTMI